MDAYKASKVFSVVASDPTAGSHLACLHAKACILSVPARKIRIYIYAH